VKMYIPVTPSTE